MVWSNTCPVLHTLHDDTPSCLNCNEINYNYNPLVKHQQAQRQAQGQTIQNHLQSFEAPEPRSGLPTPTLPTGLFAANNRHRQMVEQARINVGGPQEARQATVIELKMSVACKFYIRRVTFADENLAMGRVDLSNKKPKAESESLLLRIKSLSHISCAAGYDIENIRNRPLTYVDDFIQDLLKNCNNDNVKDLAASDRYEKIFLAVRIDSGCFIEPSQKALSTKKSVKTLLQSFKSETKDNVKLYHIIFVLQELKDSRKSSSQMRAVFDSS